VDEALRELPQVDQSAVYRADAARNRERLLCTAARLFAERGAGNVSMDEIAEAAGVGKGTLFRRFGSRAALASAVLDEHERALQDGFIRGEPPLGPGAPPRERLVAFGEALLDMLEAHHELLLEADLRGARFITAPYHVHRLHLLLLLQQADAQCDAGLQCDLLMAALSPELFIHLRHVRGLDLERLKRGWGELVSRVLGAGRAPATAATAAPAAEPEPVARAGS
jgi:AcrR family transcriptional regulator